MQEDLFDLKIVASGAHVSEKFGYTLNEIRDDYIEMNYVIKAGRENKKDVEIIPELSIIMNEMSEILKKEKPDYLILLGDRYETYGAAVSSFFLRIPIAHIGGGTITKGGCFDDVIRHSISKLASIHFVTCKENADHLIKLGEEEWRVVISGSTAIENIINEELYFKKELEKMLNIDLDKKLILFTQHSVTSEADMADIQVRESLEALKELGYQAIITYPNNDVGGMKIIEEYRKWDHIDNFIFVKNLGRKKYLSLMKYASVVVGNSSSGILETPILKIPAVNIGSRQSGRKFASNIITCDYNKDEIIKSIRKTIFDKNFQEEVKKTEYYFGDGHASEIIIDSLKKFYNRRDLLDKSMIINY